MKDANLPKDAERDVRTALIRGWHRKCPNCGTGPMMRGYLSVRDSCEVCGEDLHHHRADDGPAWATILVSGHIIAPLMLFVFETWEPDPLLMSVGFSVAFVGLALFMLPRVKGVFVGYQWAHRMHGFADDTT